MAIERQESRASVPCWNWPGLFPWEPKSGTSRDEMTFVAKDFREAVTVVYQYTRRQAGESGLIGFSLADGGIPPRELRVMRDAGVPGRRA